MILYADVILPLPLNKTFSYIIPDSLAGKAKIGSRVLVSFHRRSLTGFIVNLRKRNPAAGFKLKEVFELLDEKPVFSASFLTFTRKVSENYSSSWGELLQASLPPSFVLKAKIMVGLSDKGKKAIQNKTHLSEEKELLLLLQKRPYSKLFLRNKLKVKNISLLISRMERKGLIYTERDIKRIIRREKVFVSSAQTQLEMDFSLDKDSQSIGDYIAKKIKEQTFSPFFLYGSAEKREAVYFYLIKSILDSGRRVLFLMPEISLTEVFVEKFEKRLGSKAALLHSLLTDRMREIEWRRIKNGEASVVVGPRSSVFSPVDNLGLVIVDEEHDESYFQPESPTYDARKGAWLRAKQENAVLLSGSDTPSIEEFYRAKKKGYLFCLENEARKRQVTIVDDRGGKEIISKKLQERIKERLKSREQILIFFNRRGYASFLFCSKCNYMPRCIHCDIALVYHRREEKLSCHYCNYTLSKMNDCPQCGSTIIGMRGFGIEVVEEDLKKIFPRSKIACFDSDAIKSKEAQSKILSSFKKGKIDILIGTQFLAHQVILPPILFIAVLYPEKILMLSDFKANQKTFQSINQTIRLLSPSDKAEVFVQTAFPNHFSICCAVNGDYPSFFKQEIKIRRIMNYPPFSFMAEVLFQGDNLRTLAHKSREFSSQIKDKAGNIEVLGPALASVSRVKGRSRIQIILKSKKEKDLRIVLKEILPGIKFKKALIVFH
ncbi:primosomal protein N' [Acidobacteriota bacterium]